MENSLVELDQSKIGDINFLRENFQCLFDLGGYVAGGSLRRALRTGSIVSSTSEDTSFYKKKFKKEHNLRVTIAHKELYKNWLAKELITKQSSKDDVGDIDFYFRTPEDFEKAKNILITAKGCRNITDLDKNTKYANSYALNVNGKTTLVQLVGKWVGEPAEVVEEFDFTTVKYSMMEKGYTQQKSLLIMRVKIF